MNRIERYAFFIYDKSTPGIFDIFTNPPDNGNYKGILGNLYYAAEKRPFGGRFYGGISACAGENYSKSQLTNKGVYCPQSTGFTDRALKTPAQTRKLTKTYKEEGLARMLKEGRRRFPKSAKSSNLECLPKLSGPKLSTQLKKKNNLLIVA